jgi:PAS domain-containing protein
MKPEDKTKKELIDELETSRERISELEAYEKNARRALQNFSLRSAPSFPQPSPMQEGIAIVFDRKLEFINDVFAELFGVSPEEACSPGFDPMSLIAPQSRRLIRKNYLEGCRGAYRSKQINYTGLSKDGSTIECESFLLFIPYKWGVAVQCTLKSVSVSQRVDEALRRHYSELPGSLLYEEPDALLHKVFGSEVFKKQMY